MQNIMANIADRFRDKKTNQRELFNYLVRMERLTAKETGVAGVYPTSGQVQLVFGISRERVRQYFNLFKDKLKVNVRRSR